MKGALFSMVLLLSSPLFGQNQHSDSETQESAEIELVRETLTDYIEGSTNGQPDRLRRAFHHDLNLYSIKNGAVSVWSGKDYIKDTKEGKPTGETGKIISIDFENDAAVAKVEISHPNSKQPYVDYFMLLKVKGNWTIIHKMFTRKISAQPEIPNDPAAKIERPKTPKGSPVELSEGVDEAVHSLLTEHHVPGAAVVIVKDGKTVFMQGYGLANVEQQTAVDPEKTLFRIGSISKALTLLALTRQIDRNRLQLNDDVTQFIDGIKNPHGFTQPVTIENLLTHTSGFDQIGRRDRQVREFDHPLADRKAARPGLAEYLKTDNLRRVTPPGQYVRYDTYGSTLAGVVMESVTGIPYANAMQKEMFEPLGMTRSFVEADAKHLPDLATGYGFVDGNYVAQPYEVYVTTPASSIDATPADMGRLLQALTGDGANQHGRLLEPETTAKVLAPQFRPHAEFPGVTHGLFETFSSDNDRFGHQVRQIGHGGSMRGFLDAMVIVPEFKLGIYVVANRDPESGGGNVPIGLVVDTVVANLPNVPERKAFALPTRDKQLDLGEYEGDYCYGVFCHESTEEEQEAGVWPRGPLQAVVQKDGALLISGEEYLPRGGDVFVKSDGQRMVYFGRNDSGKVSFYVFSTSADTFERIED